MTERVGDAQTACENVVLKVLPKTPRRTRAMTKQSNSHLLFCGAVLDSPYFLNFLRKLRLRENAPSTGTPRASQSRTPLSASRLHLSMRVRRRALLS